MKISRILFAGVLPFACAAPAPAVAQSTFPSQAANVRVGGTVMMACDDTGKNCGPVSSTSPLRTAPAPMTSTPVRQGGTIATTGGTAVVTFVSTSDTEVVNPSTGTLWGSWGTPAVNGANSYPITPGGSYRPPNRAAGTFTLLSTIDAQTYTVTRF